MARVIASDAPIHVRVPARPDFVRVLRAVASSVAARGEMSFDAVEEIRIAVDEAATLMLGLRSDGAGTLAMSLEPFGNGLRARITLTPGAIPRDPDELRTSWPWRVLAGLCDDVVFEPIAEHPSIRFMTRHEAGTPR
jgi:serine/threonine-protein kinase RsbW